MGTAGAGGRIGDDRAVTLCQWIEALRPEKEEDFRRLSGKWIDQSERERGRMTLADDAECWRRRRFEPHADRRLSHRKRVAHGVRLEFLRDPTGSPQTRRMAQIGVGAHTCNLLQSLLIR